MIPKQSRPKRIQRPAWSLERLRNESAIALCAALEPASNLSYDSAFRSYIDFCDKHHFPIEPTPDTLRFYIVYMSHYIKPQSVEAYLSGIFSCLELEFPNVRTLRHHRLVSKTLAGCKKLRMARVTRKQPLTRGNLAHASLLHLKSDSHDDVTFVSLLSTGFFGLMRLGELVWPDNPALRDCRKCILRSSVTVTPQTYSFVLPSHKADRFFEGSKVIINASSSPEDPYNAFLRYLVSRDCRFRWNPYLWLLESGTPPTRRWFISRLRLLFPPEISGHSLRAGGATALAEDGVPLDLIQALGRWASETFRVYIRKHPSILAASLKHRHSD